MRLSKSTLLVAGVVIAIAAATVSYFLGSEELPDGLIQVNGRMEGDRITVATKYQGRIASLEVREGAMVEPGQIMLTLEDTRTQAQLLQAEENVNQLLADVRSKTQDLEVFRKEVPLRITQAKEALDEAQARLEEDIAREEQQHRDTQRFTELAEQGVVSKQEGEQSNLNWIEAKKALDTGRATVVRAKKDLEDAKLGQERISVREDELISLKAQLRRAQASVQEVRSVLDDLTIRAPAKGVVTTRLVDVGETVNAGGALYELVNLDRLYLKAYVAEEERGKVAFGQPARIFVDAFPDSSFPATVRYIASEAEFTPKEIQTKQERAKLVYEVRLYADENPEGRLTPGMPADGIIKWRKDADWAKPIW